MVVYVFGAHLVKDRRQLLASNVDLVEVGLGVEVTPSSPGEVVDYDDFVSCLNQGIDKMGAYEAGSSGNKNPTHITLFLDAQLLNRAGASLTVSHLEQGVGREEQQPWLSYKQPEKQPGQPEDRPGKTGAGQHLGK